MNPTDSAKLATSTNQPRQAFNRQSAAIANPTLPAFGGIARSTLDEVIHELWDDPDDDGRWTFCLVGPMGDDARSLVGPNARVVWTVGAANHLEAMTRYYEHMGWGEYTTDFPEIDGQSYTDRGYS